jgi:hypothetical protein
MVYHSARLTSPHLADAVSIAMVNLYAHISMTASVRRRDYPQARFASAVQAILYDHGAL